MKRFVQKGQTLIEVLIALGVIVVIVTSITIAVVTSLNNAEFVKNQNLATQYAQQGMEITRFMRNTQYGTFVHLNGTYCLADSCSQIETNTNATDYPNCGSALQYNGQCPQNIPASNPIFVRYVKFSNPSSQCTNGTGVESTVQWADNKCTSTSSPYCHKATLFSCFSSGDIIPIPQ